MSINFETGNASCSIANCTFETNSVTDDGGALVVRGYGGNVSITNCTFQKNSALRYIGNAIITKCIFQNNRASGGLGGAMSLDMFEGDVNIIITDCTFENNSACLLLWWCS